MYGIMIHFIPNRNLPQELKELLEEFPWSQKVRLNGMEYYVLPSRGDVLSDEDGLDCELDGWADDDMIEMIRAHREETVTV